MYLKPFLRGEYPLTLVAVRVTVDGLAGDIATDPVVADEEVLGVAGVGSVGPLVRTHVDLEPATAHVSGVTPQHLGHQHLPGLALLHTEPLHQPGLQAPDVSVPEIVDDLREVDVLCEGPGHVLPDPRGVSELTGGPLEALLVEDLWVVQLVVEDHGALVGPDLGDLRQLLVPLEGRQAGDLRGGHPQLAGLDRPPQVVMSQ